MKEEWIPKKDLVPHRTYLGEGRFLGQVGYWDGEVFHGLQYKFGQVLNTSAKYGARGFSPLALMPTLDEHALMPTPPTPTPHPEDRFEMGGVMYEATAPTHPDSSICYGCAFYAGTGEPSAACIAAPLCVGVRRHDKRDVIFKAI